jgi:predicted component of type VI protein secretion system
MKICLTWLWVLLLAGQVQAAAAAESQELDRLVLRQQRQTGFPPSEICSD